MAITLMAPEGETETKPEAKKPAWERREQNGQKEYKPGSTGAKVWAIAAKHTKDGLLDAAAVVRDGEKAGIVKGSINAALVTYRRFHAIKSLQKSDSAKTPKPKADLKVVKTVDGGTAVVKA